MKKIIALLSLCFLFAVATESKAQVQSMTATTYTVVNSGTINLGLKLNGYYKNVSIQYVATKVSGTVGGTATLKGSIDGTNYVSIPVDAILDTTNAYTNTDVTTNTRVWVVKESPYLYYRIACVGTGTMNAIVSAVVMPRNE